MDDSLTSYRPAFDAEHHTVALTKYRDTSWTAHFVFQQQLPGRLTLDGTAAGHVLHLELRPIDGRHLLLLNRGFH